MTDELRIPVFITYPQREPQPWDGLRDSGGPILAQHLNGWLTTEQLRLVTGSNEIRPWLGILLITDDGPDVYDLEWARRDLVDLAAMLSERQSTPVGASRLDQLDDLELALLMRTLLLCQNTSTAIEPDFVDHQLAQADPDLIAKALPGYVPNDTA